MYRVTFFLSLLLILTYSLVACRPGSLREDEFVSCDQIDIPADMKCIPGGPFLRGSNRTVTDENSNRAASEGYGDRVRHPLQDEAPEMTVTVSTFFMDTYEVTYSQYQECVAAGACGKAGPHYQGYSNPAQPMLGVNWYDARDYCKWKDKRLPTEAEWEKAARGPDGDIFPWGNEVADCSRAIIMENGQRGCGTGRTWKVGARDAGRYGLFDMAGNSWEWVNDWYSNNYTECGDACAGRDPQGPCDGAEPCQGHRFRVLKGGSWWWTAEYAQASNRRHHYPSNSPYHHFGFRCARSIDKKP